MTKATMTPSGTKANQTETTMQNLPTLPDDLITSTVAAKLALCQVVAVHRWVQAGRIRGWKRAGRLFVSEAEVRGLFKPVTCSKDSHAARLQASHNRAVSRALAERSLRDAGWL